MTDDLRTLLDAAVSGPVPHDTALKRVRRRAIRLKRARRIGAIVTAVLVSAAGLAAVYQLAPLQHRRDRVSAPAPLVPEYAGTLAAGSTGDQLNSVGFADGSVWVSGYDHDSVGVLLRIDPTTGRTLARLRVPLFDTEVGGGGIAVADGYVWVVGYEAVDSTRRAAVARIDPDTNDVSTILLDTEETDGITMDGDSMLVVGHRTSDNDAQASLFRVDLAATTAKDLGDIPLGTTTKIINIDGNIWIQSVRFVDGGYAGHTLSQLDVASGQVTATIDDAGIIATDGAELWVVHSGALGSVLQAYDPVSGKPTGEAVALPGDPRPEPPAVIGGQIWMILYDSTVDGSGSHVSGYDTSNHTWSATSANVGQNPIDLFGATDALWVLQYGDTITHIHLAASQTQPAAGLGSA